jgi:DNA-binding response OmpR family regulator
MIGLPSADCSSKGHILVVQDDYRTAHFIELELREEGYQVTVACDGVAALVQARQCKPNLVMLDLMIQGIDGLEVCRRLRTGRPPTPDPPIIIVTAKDSIPDRVAGLRTGADDYVTKPFSIEELLARVEALLRRSGWTATAPGTEAWLRMDDLVVNTYSREVRRAGNAIDLTAKEYELLVYLMRHQHQVLTRGQIYEAVWQYDCDLESNVLEVYIRYLRNKLDRRSRPLIHTVRGVGYAMKDK